MDLPQLGMLPAPARTALSPGGRAACGSWGALAEGGRGMQEMGTQSADPSGSLLCPAPALACPGGSTHIFKPAPAKQLGTLHGAQAHI